MNGLWNALSVALVAALASLLLKEVGGKYATVVCLVAAVLLSGYFLTRLSPTAMLLASMLKEGPLAPYGEPVLKAIGIGYLVELGGGVCRDAGAENVARGLELCGKAELLAVSLPLFSRLLGVAMELVAG